MADHLKILVFSPYYPPHVGGLQSHSAQFNQRMAQAGTQVTVFTPRLPDTARPYEQASGVTILRFPAWEIIPNYPLPQFWRPAFWQAWRKLNRLQFDIVISRTRFFFTTLMAHRYARRQGLPLLHIEHGSDFVSLHNALTNLLARVYDYTLGRFILHSANEVVANSQASADFVKRLSGRQAQVIYRGVDKEIIKNTAPDKNIKGVHRHKIIITFVGRLIDGKGVDDFLQAIKLLTTTSSQQPIHCLIIGDGPQRKKLTKLTKQLGINCYVTFLGQQNFKQAIAVLKSSDIFVNPSHTEGLPTSVIEAALCKTAIIATNVGGTPEIVTNKTSAYLISPQNPALLSSKLELLLKNPTARAQLTNHAYNEVSRKFSWQQSTVTYYKVIKQMLKS